ncbi:MAG: hypothetical protein FJ276_19870, partial [Planctomycetes bacterium]|nr:hypothetical protein [Planctomycetota bacterium]
MTSIRFVGDLPLWVGILVAALAGLGTWFIYRRELQNLSGRQRWLLPGLRTAAVVLALLILTGPVLHHRRLIGQLGRVVVFLDDSRSMSVHDHNMPVARKLLVAQAHGWLPATRIDTSLWDMANQLAETRRDVTTKLAGQSSDANVLERCRTTFAERMAATAARLEQFPWSTLPVDDGQAPPPWQDLAGRFRDELLLPGQSVRDVPLDSPEACQNAASRLLDLCQLMTAYEQSMLAAFDAVGTQLAASGNRSIAAALALFDETSRWQRAESLLVGESTGLLAKLARTHEVDVLRLTRGGAEPLWSGQGTTNVPTQLSAAIGDVLTDLSTGVGNRMTSRTGGTASPDSAETEPRTAVLLLTDGQHNSGPSP